MDFRFALINALKAQGFRLQSGPRAKDAMERICEGHLAALIGNGKTK